MIRRISSLALGIAISLTAFGALAEEAEGGGEEKAADAPAGGEEKPAGGDAAAGGDAKAGAAVDTSAPPDAGGKIKIGLRLGYALPMGDAVKDGKLGDTVSGMIPIWLDLGYMVTPNIMVGLYAQYGLLMIKDADGTGPGCPSGADCSGSDIRVGIQGQYHLSPGESLDPWFGLGIGYEMLNYKVSAGGAEGKYGLSGLEFANIQAGADFKVGPAAVGPFLSFSLGQYSSQSADPEPPGFDSAIEEKAMHQWLTLGIKGTFGL